MQCEKMGRYGDMMSATEAMDRRYSCRRYADEQVSDEELQTILQGAYNAPVALNRGQDYQLRVVRDKEVLEEIEAVTQVYYKRLGMNLSAIYHAPALILVLCNTAAAAGVPEIMRQPFLHGQVCTAACIGENMLLAATEAGLGSVFLTGLKEAVNQDESLLNKINVPDGFQVAAAVAIGYEAAGDTSGRGSREGRFEVEFI